ncbi:MULTISPECIES: restriction endonuclease subunit S [unclassified Brenneria]|uniref:restriction endonuclease subunit S n=1 Tax=unclassified Brenneria TaxID=2634434 RepID=UPI0029C38938|nr:MULTISPECIES: restriction endonuclease subunit S [unclassified Brenneria]MDX5630656.1 restriction endonuclease subunit S [Brenneria sp. L3-3Z]MDX5697781.1 restriction endonuclease subunit S [Brenneria sp. L4-2C]
MMHEGWSDGRVGDLLEGLESGVSVNGEDRHIAVDEKAVLKVSAVSYGVFDPSAAKAIETRELNRAKTNPRKGQIIISRSNTEALVGASAYITQDYPNLFLPDKLWQTIPKPNSDMKWLSYILASSHTRFTLSNLATGTSGSMKNITQNELMSLKVQIPPAKEQKKIAQILSTWDKAIATTEQLLANSQQQKKALMQQLITGKKRFPGFEGEWKKTTLETVADMNSGGTPKSSIEEYYNGGIPWVSIADMTGKGKWISSTDKTLSKFGLENSSARLYPENTVLYAMYASIGECSIARVPLCSSQAILGIRPKTELYYEYLYFFLSSLKEKIKLQGQQGTQSNLNAGMVKSFIIFLPTIEEQRIISAVLNLADQEIETLKQKFNYLKQEKKALMQQLLTGKRRVKTEEA